MRRVCSRSPSLIEFVAHCWFEVERTWSPSLHPRDLVPLYPLCCPHEQIRSSASFLRLPASPLLRHLHGALRFETLRMLFFGCLHYACMSSLCCPSFSHRAGFFALRLLLCAHFRQLCSPGLFCLPLLFTLNFLTLSPFLFFLSCYQLLPCCGYFRLLHVSGYGDVLVRRQHD